MDQNEHQGDLGPKRGKKRALPTGNSARKKSSRSTNWGVAETETLLKLVKASRDTKTRIGRSGKSAEAVWQEIAENIPGRTSDQCQRRWDTVVKSFKKIKDYCENHKVEFSQLEEKDFQGMKLATSFRSAEWFKIMDECCPSRPLPGNPNFLPCLQELLSCIFLA